MSTRLLLVRHGQASFGADDYDALSDLGGEQARVLGAALAERGVQPALVLRGSLRRHEGTVAGLLDGLGTAPDVAVDDGWDEFDFHHVVATHRPAFAMADLGAAADPRRAFQEIYDAATARWTSGGHDTDYHESFPAFRDRVAAVLDRTARRAHEHRDVVVVSSGGPIAMAAALLTAGQDPHPATLAAVWAALNRVSVNTGVTKVVASRRGLWLSTYNEHLHVEADPRLLTYR